MKRSLPSTTEWNVLEHSYPYTQRDILPRDGSRVQPLVQLTLSPKPTFTCPSTTSPFTPHLLCHRNRHNTPCEPPALARAACTPSLAQSSCVDRPSPHGAYARVATNAFMRIHSHLTLLVIALVTWGNKRCIAATVRDRVITSTRHPLSTGPIARNARTPHTFV